MALLTLHHLHWLTNVAAHAFRYPVNQHTFTPHERIPAFSTQGSRVVVQQTAVGGGGGGRRKGVKEQGGVHRADG